MTKTNNDAERVWYRQHAGVWYAYRGNQVIWCDHELVNLKKWLRNQGIGDAEWVPLRVVIARVP